MCGRKVNLQGEGFLPYRAACVRCRSGGESLFDLASVVEQFDTNIRSLWAMKVLVLWI